MSSYVELKEKLDKNSKYKEEYLGLKNRASAKIDMLKSQADELKAEILRDSREFKAELVELEYITEDEELKGPVLTSVLKEIEEDIELQNEEFEGLIKELREID